MFKPSTDTRPRLFQVLLLPNFSMLAFTSTVEPLRAANRWAGRSLYTWELVTLDGGPAIASNGIHVLPDGRMGALPRRPDAVAVCSGLGIEGFRSPEVNRWLRGLARQGIPVGGLCTGALVLARAGLLDGYRCTIHWENMESFAEEYPALNITATLFEIDRDRFTCAGGTAALDMVIALIRDEHGDALAVQAAESMIHTGVRRPDDPQRLALRERTGVSDPKVLAAIARMEAHLEAPIPVEDLARDIGVSERQLERLFRKHLSTSPSRYYLNLRLWRARALLAQTSMTVLQVAVASGFTSASHFTKCYRTYFGHAPKRQRIPGPDVATGTTPPSDPVDPPIGDELAVLETLDPVGERMDATAVPPPPRPAPPDADPSDRAM